MGTGAQLAWHGTELSDRKFRSRIGRILLVGAMVPPALIVLDLLNLPRSRWVPAIVLRLLWAAVLAALGLAIRRASATGVRVILAVAAATSVVLLTALTAIAGGSSGEYFQYMVAMPMCIVVCLPLEISTAVAAGVASLGCGVALMAWERSPPVHMARWATLCMMSSLLAVFASRTYRQLRDAERKATLERQQDLQRFSKIMAHEINNQVAILQNTIALLQKSNETDSAVLAVQQESLDQMHALTNDLAGFGEPPVGPKEPIDLLLLAHAYAQAFAPHVEVSASAESVVIIGDRRRVARALLNVVKNAVEAGSPVDLTVGKVARAAFVRVVDRGPGFGPDEASRMGQPFFTTKPRGTGLGLAIVKQVVSEHDGRFSLENQTGGGARAEIWLPVDPD